MAISRPLLLTLIGAVLAAATFFAVTSARDASTSETAAVVPASETPATQAPKAEPAAAKLSADEVMKAAVSAPPVKSGRFDGSLSVSGSEQATIDVSGAFQLAGPQDMPKVEVEIRTSSGGKDVNAGFVSTGDKGYVVVDGTGYEFPADAWTQVVEARAAGDKAAAAPTAVLGAEAASWVRDVKDEGTETIDGVETRHVSATIDGAAAMRDIAKAAGGALPAGAQGAVKDAKVDAWVGADDRIVRRISAEMAVAGETLKLEFNLSEVNDPQTIAAPGKVSDDAPPAFAQGFTQGLSLTTGVPVKAIELPANDFPQRLDRAVADHKPAVLFFRQARGLDDQATAEAVRNLDRRTNVVVLTDDVRNADRYGKLVEDLGVTQAPSIVIVDRAGKARLIEGFVDSQTLLQDVSDAR